jgi:hypothetical protein
MNELVRLLTDRFHDVGRTMTGVLTADPAGKIEKAVSIDIFDDQAIGAPDKDWQDRSDSARDASLSTLL